MALSISDNIYGYSQAENARGSAAADSVSGSLKGISKDSSEEEMKRAIKDFESYFVEQILKNVQESLKTDNDSPEARMNEYFMGSVNEKLADEIVDQVGERFTQQLYEQMCRNLHTDIKPAEAE